jgi:hypothetical protein
MGLLQVPSIGFALTTAGTLVWADKTTRIKNWEIGGSLALGGCCLMMQYNNQPVVGVCAFYDDRAEAQPGWSIWGGAMALFWPSIEQQQKKQKKIQSDLRWPLFDDAAHNNQPKTRGRNGAGLQEEVRPRGEHAGGGDTIVLEGIRSWEEVKKYNKFVELTNYVFLGR